MTIEICLQADRPGLDVLDVCHCPASRQGWRMSLLTKFRRLLVSEDGVLLQVGLGIAFILGVGWLDGREPWGNDAIRALFGILIGAAIVSAVVAHVRKRRSWAKTRTLRQTILTRPWVAVATVVWLPTAAAFAALVLRDGFARGADADLRMGLGLGSCLLSNFIGLARCHYDRRDGTDLSSGSEVVQKEPERQHVP